MRRELDFERARRQSLENQNAELLARNAGLEAELLDARSAVQDLAERLDRAAGSAPGNAPPQALIKRLESRVAYYAARCEDLKKRLDALAGELVVAGHDQRQIVKRLGENWQPQLAEERKKMLRGKKEIGALRLRVRTLQDAAQAAAQAAAIVARHADQRGRAERVERQHELQLTQQRLVQAEDEVAKAQETIDRQEGEIMRLMEQLQEVREVAAELQAEGDDQNEGSALRFIATKVGGKYALNFRKEYQQWLSRFAQVGAKTREALYELLALLLDVSVEVRAATCTFRPRALSVKPN